MTSIFQRIVRLVVEFSVLSAFALSGWQLGNSPIARAVFAIAVVALPSLIWFTVAAPGDPSGTRGILSVAGRIRFLLEFTICATSAALMWMIWSRAASETLMTALLIYYAVTWERVAWLLKPVRKQGEFHANPHATD